MKKIVVLLITLLLITNAGLLYANTNSKTFTDLTTSHWATKEINYLVQKNVINGYPNGKFGVNDSVTRAEVAVMVMRAYGWEGEWEHPGYSDITPSHWAYGSIAALYHLDIFKPKGSYKPNQPVTRAEMAEILVNAFELSSMKASKYSDVSPQHTYYNAINILSGSRVTSGYPDGTYRPESAVTRAEFAVFMSRALDESYRLVDNSDSRVEGIIYDLQVANQYYRMNNPLLLFDVWMAPIELFEKIGYVVQEVGDNFISLHSVKYGDLELKLGETRLWVGDTSVNLNEPTSKITGQFYVDVHPIVSALEAPLVFYPDQFLLALEAPQITPSQIMTNSPQTALEVVHQKQPYWHWTKKDQDYLELLSTNNQIKIKEAVLFNEMQQLTTAYEALQHEIEVINGITYVSDHVTGKLDAVSRGLEARYHLLYDNKFDYPKVGKSGGFGQLGLSHAYAYDYLVYDHTYQYLDENKYGIINALKDNTSLDFNIFNGLVAYGIPFSINEVSTETSYAGLASGSKSMLVVHSGLGTFYHELGHNWDAMLGDHTSYMALRNQSGYSSQTNDWADRVAENFAEDFVIAIMPDADQAHHRGAFGAPTREEASNIRDWIYKQSDLHQEQSIQVTLNNLSVVPQVIYSANGKLEVKGNSLVQVSIIVVKNSSNEEMLSSQISQTQLSEGYTWSLPGKGVYTVQVGHISTTIVYN